MTDIEKIMLFISEYENVKYIIDGMIPKTLGNALLANHIINDMERLKEVIDYFYYEKEALSEPPFGWLP